MVPIIESGFSKGELTKFTNAVCLSCGDDVILRRLLLKHQVHRADVVRGVPPVPPGFQIPKPQLRLKAKLDAVDIDAHGGKAIGETFSHKALGRQVVALVEIVAADDVKNARIAFETARM